MSNEKVEGGKLESTSDFLSPKFLSFFVNIKSLKLFSTTHTQNARVFIMISLVPFMLTRLSLSLCCVCLQRLYKSEESLFLS